MRSHRLGVLALSTMAALAACSKGKKGGDTPAGTPDGGATDAGAGADAGTDAGGGDGGGGGGAGEGQILVTGTVALSLGLVQNGVAVTHVVARDTSRDATHVAEVKEDGSFELPVDKGQSWVLTYVDATKTGEDMLVSTFQSGTLDTLATTEESQDVQLGDVNVSEDAATSTLEQGALLEQVGLSSDLAEAWGEVDDVSLRYSNPDIDGDGRLDAENGQIFTLDFHNRFAVQKADGQGVSMNDLKNAFPPDDVAVSFMGSGVIPWFESRHYTQPLANYTWKFSSDVTLNGECNGRASGSVLPAGELCAKAVSDANQSVPDRPSIELAAAVDGTYTLVAGGKTFTWTNVKVSDFSGGAGFLALFPRFQVDEGGKLRGMSWRWRRKAADGSWATPTAEEIGLLIKASSPGIGLKVDGTSSGKGIAIKPSLAPEGTVTFADATYHVAGSGQVADGIQVMLEGITEAEVKAGLDWTRVLENPGISYDDKLGMRFFFGFYGQNE